MTQIPFLVERVWIQSEGIPYDELSSAVAMEPLLVFEQFVVIGQCYGKQILARSRLIEQSWIAPKITLGRVYIASHSLFITGLNCHVSSKCPLSPSKIRSCVCLLSRITSRNTAKLPTRAGVRGIAPSSRFTIWISTIVTFKPRGGIVAWSTIVDMWA